eukprot:scaffold171255_cov30-Tisochrysis_lutea.AAC.1
MSWVCSRRSRGRDPYGASGTKKAKATLPSTKVDSAVYAAIVEMLLEFVGVDPEPATERTPERR